MIIHNKGDFIRHIGVRLIPGANKLEQFQVKEFEKASQHRLNKLLIESGEIVVLSGKDQKSLQFAELNAAQSIELVKDTYSLSLLDEFKQEEASNKKRTTVLKAIDEQIEAITTPPEDDSEGGEGGHKAAESEFEGMTEID